MQTFKMASLTPIQVAGMDKLPIDKQEEIKTRFGQPLTLSKAYFILRDATQNFTSTASDAARKLDALLYDLLVKKGMFQPKDQPQDAPMPKSINDLKASMGGNIIIGRPATGVTAKPAVKRVSFSDYPLAAKFMPKHQKAIVQNYDDDDKRHILEGIEKNLKNLKGYRSQDGLGDQAMVYAHYFYGQTDYFITETDFDPKAGYENLFGFAILNGDTRFAELGAVGLEELTESRRMELDFYWTPVTLGEAKAEAYPDEFAVKKEGGPNGAELMQRLQGIAPIPVVLNAEQQIMYNENEEDNDHLQNLRSLSNWATEVPTAVLEALKWLETRMKRDRGIGGDAIAVNDRLGEILRPMQEVVLSEEAPIEGSAKTPRIILGRKRPINLPNGEEHVGLYAIYELDDIYASHNEETFSDTLGYPRNQAGNNLNDRNYAADKGAQQLVAEYARDLNPNLLVSLNSSPDGTPIINTAGIVVSGNNRTMSMKLARKKYPAKWAAYQNALLNDLEIFGFPEDTAEKLAQMQAPVLVRVDYDFGEMTTTNMAKYNASAMKAKSQVDRAAELATTLREQALCETNIPAILDGYDTLGEFYADRAATRKMVAALQQCSVLNEQDLPGYVDAGLFSEDGKTMLETVLASIVLEPDTVRVANRDGVRSLRQVVVNSLPVLIANKNLPAAANLVAFINQAVQYQGELVASGLPWADFINQPKLFADQQVAYDPRSIYLNRLMLSGPRKFREALRRYNESQAAASGASMFENETVTPADAFRGYIIAAVPADEVKLVERYFPMGKDGKNLRSIAKMAKDMVEAKQQAKSIPVFKFTEGDKVVKDGTQGTVRRIVTSGKGGVINAYSVTTNDGREVYWYEDDMAPLAAIDTSAAGPSLEQKIKTATTALKLLKKAVSRLEGTRLKTAQTEIKLLTKFLEKNK